MNYFFVFQNKSYNQEKEGGYLWAPKRSRANGRIAHWERMQEVKKGDIIIHCNKQHISAVSIAQRDVYAADTPPELKNDWTKEGWRVDTKYILLEKPLLVSTYKDEFYALQPEQGGPLDKNKSGKQGYLYAVNEAFYDFVIRQTLTEIRKEEKLPLSQMEIEVEVADYKASILSNDMLAKRIQEKQHVEQKKEYETSVRVSRRDADLKELVKRFAKGRCQLCGEKAPFLDRDDRPYLEEHHVQTLASGGSDTMDNVVALCPNCHRKVHVRKESQDQFALQMAAGKNDKKYRTYLEKLKMAKEEKTNEE